MKFKEGNVKIGSKEEKFWTDLKLKFEEEKFNCTQTLILDEELIKLCEKKIKEHKL